MIRKRVLTILSVLALLISISFVRILETTLYLSPDKNYSISKKRSLFEIIGELVDSSIPRMPGDNTKSASGIFIVHDLKLNEIIAKIPHRITSVKWVKDSLIYDADSYDYNFTKSISLSSKTNTIRKTAQPIDVLSDQNQTDKILSDDFSKFISITPKLNVPFKVDCWTCCDYPTFEMHKSNIVAQYVKSGSRVIGIIKQKDYFILFTTATGKPNERNIQSITIYDSKGIKVEEKEFLSGWCGRDYDYFAARYLTVKDGPIFTQIDTAYTFRMDTEADRIIDTIKTEIQKKEFSINKVGKIIEK